MEMLKKFLPGVINAERSESQPLCICERCRSPVDIRNDYEVVVEYNGSGVRFVWHMFPCYAGPEEYDTY